MSDELKLDLDPRKVLQAIKDLSEGMKQLASDIEESLGKQAPKSIKKTEDAAEKGTSKIKTMFSNLGKQIKEDLKTAFAIDAIAGGLKFADQMKEGVKEVFKLEAAFDKLNTRLKLTNEQFASFKHNLASKVAATGQKMEDVLPGVESAAAKGGVKSPDQLASIGEGLAKVRAATGESTETLADTVVDMLKNQGKKVSGQNFNETLDALQATRVTGSFKTAGDAAKAIESLTHGLTPEAQKAMGLTTRNLGGLAAIGSKSGEGGVDVLKKILTAGQTAGGQSLVNAMLGTTVFKNGKLSEEGLKSIDKKALGKYTSQISAEGLGVDQGELARFVDSLKENMGSLKDVVEGANETSAQFDVATNSLAASFEKFKENTKNATREIGETLSTAAHDLMKGDIKGAGKDVLRTGKALWENKGTLLTGIASTVGISAIMGGAANHLLSKIPGGKLLGNIVGEEAAEAAGVQKVFVVNAAEMGGGGAGEAAGLLSTVGPKLAKYAALAAGPAEIGAAVVAGGALGYGAVKGLDAVTGGGYSKKVGGFGDWLAQKMGPSDAEIDAKSKTQVHISQTSIDALGKKMNEHNKKPVQFTHPSDMKKRGDNG